MTVADSPPAGRADPVAPARAEIDADAHAGTGAARSSRQARMHVRKRNGDNEPVDVNKIVRAVDRCAGGLGDVDPLRVATKTISGLYDGATTAELDRLSIQTAAEMIGEEPQYSRLAARLLAAYIGKEVHGQGIASFSQSIGLGHAEGLIADETAGFVKDNARKLDDAVDPAGDLRFEYFGVRTVYDRYLLRHPATRLVIEAPQYFLLRVACGLSRTPAEAIGCYRLMSSLAYLPSSPTLFNSGTRMPRCRPATWSTPRGTSWTRSTSGTHRWRSCRSSPAGSASPGRGCARAGR
jgi:ribonucleoside-diphosphate reductase alpha chain